MSEAKGTEEVLSESTPRRSRRPMVVVGDRPVDEEAAAAIRRETPGLPPSSPMTRPMTISASTTTARPDQTIAVPAALVANVQRELASLRSWRAGAIGTLNVAAAILAARAILLIAVLGAIALAVLALASHDLVRVGVLGLYCVCVVIPLVWLVSRAK